MAKKSKGQKPPREFTRHQLSRWQRQKRIQKVVFTTGIFIIAAVLALVGTGWYITQYRPMQQTVIRVNGTEFDMGYYLKILKASGQGQTFLLDYMASEVAEAIEVNEVIRQGAMELGISVSDEEIDAELQSYDLPLDSDSRFCVMA